MRSGGERGWAGWGGWRRNFWRYRLVLDLLVRSIVITTILLHGADFVRGGRDSVRVEEIANPVSDMSHPVLCEDSPYVGAKKRP